MYRSAALVAMLALSAPLAAETLPDATMDDLLTEYRLVDRVVRLIQREYVRPVDRQELAARRNRRHDSNA